MRLFDNIDSLAALSSSGRALIVVDAALRYSGTLAAVQDAIGTRADHQAVVVAQGLVSCDEAEHLSALLPELSYLVAVGGGSVIDRVKMARGLAAGNSFADESVLASRGFWIWRSVKSDLPALIAVPTTIGTGSERNQNAVVAFHGDRQLFGGPALLPNVAVYDSRSYATLPDQIVLQGVFEALVRCVETYTSPGSVSGDTLAVETARQLIRLGLQVEAGAHAEDIRLSAARLSGLSQSAMMHRGRVSFAFPLWAVVHEVATATNQPKIASLSTLTQIVHSAPEHVAGPFGEPTRRRAVLDELLDTSGIEATSSTLFGNLAQRWRLPAGDQQVESGKLAEKIVQRWAGPLGTAHFQPTHYAAIESVLRRYNDSVPS